MEEPNNTNMSTGSRGNSKRTDLSCRFCGRLFARLPSVVKHEKQSEQRGGICPVKNIAPVNEENKKVYKCKFCDETFNTMPMRYQHQVTCSQNPNPNPIKCRYEKCERTFTNLGNRRRHEKRDHEKANTENKEGEDEDSDEPNLKKIKHVPLYQCKNCKLPFENAEILERHEHISKLRGSCVKYDRRPAVYSEENKQVYPCKFCGANLPDPHQRGAHENRCKEREKTDVEIKLLKCDECGSILREAYSLRYHKLMHLDENFTPIRYGIKDEETGELIYKCTDCTDLMFDNATLLWYHIIRNHRLFEPLKNMSKNIQRSVHPFNFAIKNKNRGDSAIDESKIEIIATWKLEWMDNFAKHLIKQYERIPYKAYLVAVLDGFQGQNLDIEQFVKSNPSKVAIYVGSTSERSKHEISTRHFKGDSPLYNAAEDGKTIAFIMDWKFYGNNEEKQINAKLEEAKYIEIVLTNAEYEPRTSYKILNQRRELTNMSSLSDTQLHDLFSQAVGGSPMFCSEGIECAGRCGAIFHPNWFESKILDFTRRIPNARRQPEIVNKFNPIPRPTTMAEIQSEVDVRIANYRNKSDAFRDPTWFVYLAIVPANQTYSGVNCDQLCKDILARQEENITNGIYVGISGQDQVNSYHTRSPETSSLAKFGAASNENAIEIKTYTCSNLEEARKLEAQIQIHLFLQGRVNISGTKFNPINMHMEWIQYLKLSREEKIIAIKMGMTGVSPIMLNKDSLQVSIGFDSDKYPVNLQKQLDMDRIRSVRFIADKQDFDNLEN